MQKAVTLRARERKLGLGAVPVLHIDTNGVQLLVLAEPRGSFHKGTLDKKIIAAAKLVDDAAHVPRRFGSSLSAVEHPRDPFQAEVLEDA